MFNLYDFFQYFIPVTPEKSNLTPKQIEKINLSYLDFISNMYITAIRNSTISKENQIWFLEELAITMRQIKPNLTVLEVETFLHHIMEIAKQKN